VVLAQQGHLSAQVAAWGAANAVCLQSMLLSGLVSVPMVQVQQFVMRSGVTCGAGAAGSPRHPSSGLVPCRMTGSDGIAVC
jgi:hypothetical protein